MTRHRIQRVVEMTSQTTHQGSGSFISAVRTKDSSFDRFQLLPIEIRDMIWEAALPGPRAIRYNALSFNQRTQSVGHTRSTTQRTPVILHVCKESRAVALVHYKLTCRLYVQERYCYQYVNFAIDTLVLNSRDHFWFGEGAKKQLPPGTFGLQANIRFLATASVLHGHAPPGIIPTFTNLERVVFQLGDDIWNAPSWNAFHLEEDEEGNDVDPTVVLERSLEKKLVRGLRRFAIARGLPVCVPEFRYLGAEEFDDEFER